MSKSVLECANLLLSKGISVVPIRRDGSKAPAIKKWKHLEERLLTPQEAIDVFRKDQAGIAAICGTVSAGLQCIDLDNMEVAREYLHELRENYFDLFSKLVRVKSPRGIHLWFRCEEIAGNQKLALPSERKCLALGVKFKCLIETRGEGGYAIVPGSPADTHEDNIAYEYIDPGKDLSQVEKIDPGERNLLLELARTYDRSDRVNSFSKQEKNLFKWDGENPIDHFDRAGDTFEDLLSQTGAVFVSGSGDEGRIRRPGKEKGISATVGYCRGPKEEPLLHVFTSSWGDFPPGSYGKYQVLRILRFRTDGKEAFKYLLDKGYGTQNGHTNGKPKTKVESEPTVWEEEPIPLQDMDEALPEFPLEIFPNPLQEFIQEISHSVACPPDYAAVYALGIAAGTIGARFVLEIKQGYAETSNLWLCSVARVGGGKTPSIIPISKPIFEEQARRHKAGDKCPVYVQDVTVEKLADIMNDCPDGQLMIQDEMSAWIHSMNQYKQKGGNDRQKYLAIWSSEPIHVQRKDPTHPPVFVHHPRLSIIGGLQPDKLEPLRNGVDDGFFDRILFSFPKENPAIGEKWKIIQQKNIDRWGAALSEIRKVEMRVSNGGNLSPQFLTLNDAARDSWQQWTDWVAEELNRPELPDYLRGPLVKIRGCVGRIAMVLHLLQEAYGFRSASRLDADIIDQAAKLGKYFLSHAERVYRWAGRDQRIKPAQHILVWLKKQTISVFKRSDLWRLMRNNKLFSKPEDLIDPLKLLLAHRYIRYIDESTGQNLGRKSSPIYEINPLILGKYH